jgi:hypothetical protein
MLAEICQYAERNWMPEDHVASYSFEDCGIQCEPQLRQTWTACEVVWMSEQSADAVTRMEEKERGVIDSAASEGLGPGPNCKPKVAKSPARAA